MLDGTKDLYEMSKKLLAFCEKYKDEIPYDDLNNLHELWSRIYNNLQTEEEEVEADGLLIDIYQYIQWDDDGVVIYFDETNFVNDAREYLEQHNPEHEIK
jgi:hypothetical protein